MKQSPAAFLHIPPGRVEIVGVPRIGYLAGTVGKVHQQVHLVGKIAAADPVHTPQVGSIHANQKIVLLVIAVQELTGSLAGAIDAMLGQFAAGWRIYRIADLLGAGSCRLDLNARLQTGFLHQILHNELGHRASANVAVAEEKYLDHAMNTPNCCFPIQYSTEHQIRRVGFPDGRQNRFFSGVLPLTSRNDQQHEDTSADPPAPCLLPG